MIIAVISILVITAVVWMVNKFVPFTVCPICAGVFLTWVGFVGAHFVGYEINLFVPALLMGGTVVGLAYQLDKKIGKSSLLWKELFITAGFVAMYGILEQEWTAFLAAVIFLLLITLIPMRKEGAREETIGDLEKKMKEDCC